MGIWAGIKHALNSTLGTSDFKPLDELIADKIAKIVSGKSLAASDTTYKTLSSSAVSVEVETLSENYVKLGNSFTVNAPGSIRIIASVTNPRYTDDMGTSYTTQNAKIYIVKGSINYSPVDELSNIFATIDTGITSNAETKTVKYDLTVSAGTTYSVLIGDSTNKFHDKYLTCNSLKIGAAVVEGSLIS